MVVFAALLTEKPGDAFPGALQSAVNRKEESLSGDELRALLAERSAASAA